MTLHLNMISCVAKKKKVQFFTSGRNKNQTSPTAKIDARIIILQQPLRQAGLICYTRQALARPQRVSGKKPVSPRHVAIPARAIHGHIQPSIGRDVFRRVDIEPHQHFNRRQLRNPLVGVSGPDLVNKLVGQELVHRPAREGHDQPVAGVDEVPVSELGVVAEDIVDGGRKDGGYEGEEANASQARPGWDLTTARNMVSSKSQRGKLGLSFWGIFMEERWDFFEDEAFWNFVKQLTKCGAVDGDEEKRCNIEKY
ncbi:ABC-2 type transporter family protein [Striga asiatica]|uniref:ABC-2 type transporter family protein n=1 Tax=Striga asiatica TaxID=4170 RepID=A0A5A7QWB1_STRAF|nr:ABC-2 type transporter family protein [Striga asiatica]